MKAGVRALAAAAVLAAVGYAGLFERTFAATQDLHVSPRVAELARERGGWTPGTPIVSAGYQEPSLVFLTATGIELVGDGAEAAAFLAAHPGGYAIVEGRHRETFDKAAAGLGAAQVATVSGFNYSRGQRVEIAIFRAPAPRSAP